MKSQSKQEHRQSKLDLALHRLSIKNFDLKAPREHVSGFSKDLSYVNEGIIQSDSGYLAICTPYDVNIGNDYLKYLFIPPKEAIKKFGKPTRIIQSDDFIDFSIGYNDLLLVFSSKRRFYIDVFDTLPLGEDSKIALDYLNNGNRPRYHNETLEGFVGCFGGSLVVVDPEKRPLLPDIPSPVYLRNEFIPRLVTILETGKGTFQGRFIGRGNHERFSLRRI